MQKQNMNPDETAPNALLLFPLAALHVSEPAERTADPIERAQACQELVNQSALHELRLYRQDQVVQAEKRRALQLEKLCVDCHKEIHPERLHVEPTATRCIDCQTRYARRNLRFGSRKRHHHSP